MATKLKLTANISITTSIILMVVGSFLIKYRSIVISSIIFLLAVTIAALGLAIVVRKFRYKKDNNELLIGMGMLVGGIILAFFTDIIAQYGLVAIGALFLVFGLLVIIDNVKRKTWFYMSLGIVRVIIGSALIVLAFTNPGAVQSTLALITGIAALTIGFIFLLLEK